uniref:Uncharacterized protein n=1 Tax=Ignisphaera aggregans TaxID=334771 RepID=A0A7J3YU46_9CREN
MMIFTGPTASGKTTLMKILCRRMREKGKRCICVVSPPFGGLSYLIIMLLSKILTCSCKLRITRRTWRGFTILEKFNRNLIPKILPLAIVLDFLFKTLQHTTFMIAEKLDFIVLVEDYFPQMISEHLIFSKYYRSRSKIINYIITLELRILHKYVRKNRDAMCIHVYADPITRTLLELKRSGEFVDMNNFYDNFVRHLMPRTICKALRLKVIQVTSYSKEDAELGVL